jgi:hypothetical protein
VAYEAGPTGFVLARALRAAGIRCEVLAPSRLQRPAGDRIKTDSRDAMHLAKLLRLDEFTPVRVPLADEEAARDLVRAREDARGDVMRARHRVSKLLLRQGIVYSGGGTWTHTHHRWLQRQRLGLSATQIAYESAYETVVLTEARRERLDVAITGLAAEPDWAPMVAKLSCLRGISTLTAGPTSVWCPASSPAAPNAARVRSPRPVTPMPAECWSKPPGITAALTAPPECRCVPAGTPHRLRHGPGGMRATRACMRAGDASAIARNPPWSPT